MFKKIFGFIIITFIVILTLTTSAFAYSDVSESHWFYNSVSTLTDKGIVEGNGDNTFAPYRNVTRAEFVVMALRIVGINYDETNSWHDGVMQAGYLAMLINEKDYPIDTWNTPITRYEATEISHNIMTLYQGLEDKDISIVSRYIPDEIPERFKNAVCNSYLSGLIKGVDSKGTFYGERTLTRAEAATIIHRIIDENKRNPWIQPEEDFSQVLGEFTTYTTDNINRNFNINKSSEAINNTILYPGEEFSYYACIGNAGKKEGYKLSTVISNGKYVNGYGGGVCQTATTLFNAVLLSNLQIDERRAHGLKSSYVDPGYDATYSSGYIDFKFTNNFYFPIKIVSHYDEATNALTVQIIGSNRYTKPVVKLYTTGSGSNWTLYREVDGEVNYSTVSNYRN